MKYLIQIVANDPPPTEEGKNVAAYIRNLVFPSMDKLSTWEAEGRISGGIRAGERAIAFVAQAENNQAIDDMIRELPVWQIAKTQVTPLTGFTNRKAQDESMLSKMGL